MTTILVRDYQNKDEQSWLRCRVLSFLDTAYFDNVLREKENYNNPSIELVAIIDNQVVGLLDVECDRKERTVCSRGEGLGGMIWHIAVHPDFRRLGIGTKLLMEAEKRAKQNGLNQLEAWTRDDQWVTTWYKRNHFEEVDSYLHVYLDGAHETEAAIASKMNSLYLRQGFAHYVGSDQEMIKQRFERVHTCVCFEKKL